jgi:hypothetical protein
MQLLIGSVVGVTGLFYCTSRASYQWLARVYMRPAGMIHYLSPFPLVTFEVKQCRPQLCTRMANEMWG